MDTKIDDNIRNADKSICDNIRRLSDDRPLLAQNILANLRNLIEASLMKIYSQHHNKDSDIESYRTVKDVIKWSRSRADLKFFTESHALLQKSTSHYTRSGEGSERLLLQHYANLLLIKKYMKNNYDCELLANISDFPINQDPSQQEYHEKISERINTEEKHYPGNTTPNRYYIDKIKPFFIEEEVYYEVTFYTATDNISKFDRHIAFTSIYMSGNYASRLVITDIDINVFGHNMPIKIIRQCWPSIRPCELNNFAKIFGKKTGIKRQHLEYQEIMRGLSAYWSLADFIASPEYEQLKDSLKGNPKTKMQIVPILDEARKILTDELPGHNVIRYLLLRMHNRIIKKQYGCDACDKLSGLHLKYECIPFEEMPYATALKGHNPRIFDLLKCIPARDREHELLARLIKNNTEKRGRLYTPIKDIEGFQDIEDLMSKYNSKLYYKHVDSRKLEKYCDNILIGGYGSSARDILIKLSKLSEGGLEGYVESVKSWLEKGPYAVDCAEKKEILGRLFGQSKAAFIYGAAGTGKSTMVNHISQYFSNYKKLYLANTHSAVYNLKNKVTAGLSEFKTIAQHIQSVDKEDYAIVFVDECSTVSNSDILEILKRTSFSLIVLVGDIYQIESISFGNWFKIVKSFIPTSSIFELEEIFRTEDKKLNKLWNSVRNINNDIVNHNVINSYSRGLDKSIFKKSSPDEIILCLNYDGLYGINNVNQFLQSHNENPAKRWGIKTYKKGDPVIFNELKRFRPLIYNNLKGKIVDISSGQDKIQFDIQIDRAITELDVKDVDVELIGIVGDQSIIRFDVHRRKSTDNDNDSENTVVPFQVAYAVSIHKAQGLEYESVKVIITDETEEAISHGIFYTAITRSKKDLKIYWTPEVESRVINNFKLEKSKDACLISKQYSIKPWSCIEDDPI